MIDDNIHTLNFEDFLNELVKERGLTLKKISEATGISLKHLVALASGNFGALPSSPYFRGYLTKLGRVLEFDPAPWWTRFREGGFVKDAGSSDAPPANRFIRPAYVKFVWIGAAAIAMLLYGAVRLPAITGRPTITVAFPATNPAHVATNIIELRGGLNNGDDLVVNGETVPVDESGAWRQAVLLQAGANMLDIRAKKFLGGETALVWEIFYEPAATPSSSRQTVPNALNAIIP